MSTSLPEPAAHPGPSYAPAAVPVPASGGATASRLLPGYPAPTPAASVPVTTEERPHPLTPVVQIWVWLVAIALFVLRQLAENPGDVLGGFDLARFPWWLLAFVAMAAVSLGRNFWTWYTTRFVATATELRIDHKGVEHESRRVAYTRIQAVDVTQPFAARLLGMAEVTIDVGGGKPLRLQYLSRSRATELRDFLLARAHGRDAAGVVATSAWDDSGAHDRILLRVPPGELVLGAVLSHELVLLVLAAGIPLGIGLATGQPWLVGGGVLPILLSIAGFLSTRVMGQFNYTLAETPAGLRITRGLTSLSSETLPVQRVQAIRLHEPVLWRLIGRTRVDLSFLGMGKATTNEDGVGASSIMVPIGRPDAVRAALNAVWPGLHLDAIPLTRSPRRARWLAPLGYASMGYGLDGGVLVFRSGWWTRTTWVMPHARLQSASVSTGPLRRALGVADVAVHTSGFGAPATVYLPDADAATFVYAEMGRARASRGLEQLLTESSPITLPEDDPNR